MKVVRLSDLNETLYLSVIALTLIVLIILFAGAPRFITLAFYLGGLGEALAIYVTLEPEECSNSERDRGGGGWGYES